MKLHSFSALVSEFTITYRRKYMRPRRSRHAPRCARRGHSVPSNSASLGPTRAQWSRRVRTCRLYLSYEFPYRVGPRPSLPRSDRPLHGDYHCLTVCCGHPHRRATLNVFNFAVVILAAFNAEWSDSLCLTSAQLLSSPRPSTCRS